MCVLVSKLPFKPSHLHTFLHCVKYITLPHQFSGEGGTKTFKNSFALGAIKLRVSPVCSYAVVKLQYKTPTLSICPVDCGAGM